MPTNKQDLSKIIAIQAPVKITAAQEGEDGKKTPPKFDVTAYTGVAMNIAGYDLPVVVDLAGLQYAKSIIANLDHEGRQRVGHVTEKSTDNNQLRLQGVASAATSARDEVVNSAAEGFVWQASVEVQPNSIEEVPAGKTAEANGQEFNGPLYITRSGLLSAFAFVSHGADDNTGAKIAANADSKKEKNMPTTVEAELKSFIEEMLPGIDAESLSEEAIANLRADFQGKEGKRKSNPPQQAKDPFTARKAERDRQQQIRDIADSFLAKRPEEDIEAVEKMYDHAIEAKMDPREFRTELLEASLPYAHTVSVTRREPDLNSRVVEAAICMTGRLEGHEEIYDDRTLQAAHDRFKQGIGLKQLLVLAAESNGHRCSGYDVDIDVQRAAFGLRPDRTIHASGFSTFSLPNTLANVANKFIREGWMHVDQAWNRISTIRPVRDFKQTSTVSLTGGLIFEELGPDGQIKHGEVGELQYTNQADTYAKMFAITRKDIINDDLGALTAVPRRLGRGGALKLNDIFWTVFLNNSSFFTSGNNNVSTDTGALSTLGLEEANTIFMEQTDPDGTPLGAMPRILLVPTALEATARQLMTSEKIKGDTDEPDANVWRGRFDVVSSPYMSNSTYTGNSAIAWYLLADPNDIPVIEVAALNGRVEPTVDTADADFNVLGIQMRGYSDVGVALQEFRGGVRADGSAAD